MINGTHHECLCVMRISHPRGSLVSALPLHFHFVSQNEVKTYWWEQEPENSKQKNRSLIGQHLVHYPMKFTDECHYGGEIVDSTEKIMIKILPSKNVKITPKPD